MGDGPGVASIVAGNIVSVGYIVVGTTLVSDMLVWRIQQSIQKQSLPNAVAAST